MLQGACAVVSLRPYLLPPLPSPCPLPALSLPSPCPPAATLEEARERGELQRVYYLLLSAVTTAGMSGALLKVPPGVLEAAVLGLTRGAATHVDPTVRRTCLQVFSRLVGDWCGSPAAGATAAAAAGAAGSGATAAAAAGAAAAAPGGEVVPGFRRYAMERLGEEACLFGLLRSGGGAQGGGGGGAAGGGGGGGLDVRDAAVLNLLGDAAAALKLIYSKCGEEFPGHLVSGDSRLDGRMGCCWACRMWGPSHYGRCRVCDVPCVSHPLRFVACLTAHPPAATAATAQVGTVFPALGLAGHAQQQLVFLIREGEAKALRDYLRELMTQAQQQQQQQQQQQGAAR